MTHLVVIRLYPVGLTRTQWDHGHQPPAPQIVRIYYHTWTTRFGHLRANKGAALREVNDNQAAAARLVMKAHLGLPADRAVASFGVGTHSTRSVKNFIIT